MRHIRTLSVWVYVLGAAILFGATIYQMMVVVPAFTANLPASMVEFAAGPVKTPAFWTSPIGPLTGVAGIIALITCRRMPAFRLLALSVGLAFAAEIITILWVYPMLREMGITGAVKPVPSDALTAVTTRWVLVDQLRCAFFVVPGMIAGLAAFRKLGTTENRA